MSAHLSPAQTPVPTSEGEHKPIPALGLATAPVALRLHAPADAVTLVPGVFEVERELREHLGPEAAGSEARR